MKKNVLVVQHVASEGLGTMARELDLAGFNASFVRVYRNDEMPKSTRGYAGLIILGGPMGVYEDVKYPFIKKEIRLLESALTDSAPVFGVCLGAQMLAKAAGARVYKGHTKEIGWSKVALNEAGSLDALFRFLPNDLTVFQLHGDTFDVPEDGVNLASSASFPNQAIRVGSSAYGLQFHIEVTERIAEDWINMNRADIEKLKAACAHGEELGISNEDLASMSKAGRAIIARFIRSMR